HIVIDGEEGGREDDEPDEASEDELPGHCLLSVVRGQLSIGGCQLTRNQQRRPDEAALRKSGKFGGWASLKEENFASWLPAI
ncbi:MAG: hypothetical protein KDD06_25145, partial [Phaeodactylibacter sp.]|nr:hypothetical protein [Phaeodactylibacter sp.]